MQSVLHTIVGPKKEIHDLDGRVAMVTSGALGIGARHHDQPEEEQGQDAIDKIKKEAGPDAKIKWIPCDLGSLNEVKEVFTGVREREKHLDLLILSAGINTNKNGEDADGIDRHFGVNWLGHFYACNLLYPLIRKTSKMPDTPAPRIVWESSEMHRGRRLSCIVAPSTRSTIPRSGLRSCTAGASWLSSWGSRTDCVQRVIKPNGDNVYALSVHPGTVNTAMQQQWKEAYPGLLGNILTSAMLFVGRDVEQGSYSALYAATSPEVEEIGWNGYYLQDPGSPGKEFKQASDPMLGAALWDLSHRIIREKIGQGALVSWTS